MTGFDGGRAAVWYRRIMRIALPFALASLTWNIVQIYALITAGEGPKPGTIVTILLNASVAVVLIWQGLLYWQRSRR
jgi:hypothetical protein